MLPTRKRNRISKVPTEPTKHIIASAQTVIDCNDLLKEIVLRLPIKSLFRFKSVSKYWNFTISQKDFLSLCKPSVLRGLFYHISSNNCVYWSTEAKESNCRLEFLPLQHDNFHFESITHIPNLSCLIILNSCNGLLLCLGYNELERKGGYQVVNPTSKKFSSIETPPNPKPKQSTLVGVFLSYNPLVSPHYKIVGVRSTGLNRIIIVKYSSETKAWRVSRKKYKSECPSDMFYGGVYWNSAINWFNPSYRSFYFKVEEEQIGTIPALKVPRGLEWNAVQILYYGESCGHLYCAEIYGPTVIFDVHEMKKDYSEWIVKYNVDLAVVASDFPEITLVIGSRRYCSYEVLCVVPEGDYNAEGAFMVLHIPGKFIRYDLKYNSYKIIREYEGPMLTTNSKFQLQINPYIESRCSV